MNKSKIDVRNELGKVLAEIGLLTASIGMNMNLIHLELNKVTNFTNQLKKENHIEKNNKRSKIKTKKI